MIFSSITFLYFFLPAVILVYLVMPAKAKNSVIFISSLFFYAWGEKLLVLLFLGSIIFGWIMGLLIEKKRNSPWSKVFLIFAVIVNLGILFYFKYTDFFIQSINQSLKISIPLLKIALPIGISFYTFQLLSYEVDVYRGTVPSQKSFIDFGTYVAMFPQLIAGPIVRYSDIQTQLKNRQHTLEKTSQGIGKFILGFSKKVLIANSLGQFTAFFRTSTDLSVLYYWLYALAYMLQIYFDFSGYSDMAIGLGKIFGFEFNKNFDYPYISKSITEFWRRWHISLGTWFKDYVYIPLGGNRKGKGRQIFNIFVVWMLTGLWHGAAWNFVLWGIYFAILLIIEKLFLKKFLDKHNIFAHIYLLFLILLGFVLFNASSLNQAVSDIAGLFSFGKLPLISAEAIYYLKSYGIIIALAVIFATPLPKNLYIKLSGTKAEKFLMIAEPLVLAFLLIIGTAFLVDGSFNPFLYFRF